MNFKLFLFAFAAPRLASPHPTFPLGTNQIGSLLTNKTLDNDDEIETGCLPFICHCCTMPYHPVFSIQGEV
jgi:hypothetical protein